jgi:hypothetical protein
LDLPAAAGNGVTTRAGRVMSTGMVDWPLRPTPRASSHHSAVAGCARVRISSNPPQLWRATRWEAKNDTRSTSVRAVPGQPPRSYGIRAAGVVGRGQLDVSSRASLPSARKRLGSEILGTVGMALAGWPLSTSARSLWCWALRGLSNGTDCASLTSC